MVTNTATVETTQSVHAVATTPDDVFSHMTQSPLYCCLTVQLCESHHKE